MLPEGALALVGRSVGGLWLFPYESLVDRDVAAFLQLEGMACEVAIGEVQALLEGIEIDLVRNHEQGHDRQADAVLENLVDMF